MELFPRSMQRSDSGSCLGVFFEERIGLLLSTGEPRRTQDGLNSPRPSSFVDQSAAVAQDAPALSGLARSTFVQWHMADLRANLPSLGSS